MIIDLSSKFGKVRPKIKTIGMEFEGGWHKLPEGVSGLAHDGSVVFVEYPAKEIFDETTGRHKIIYPNGKPPKFIGELPSPVLTLADYQSWMKANYPTHVNKTCGMHVHMGFSNARVYSRLMHRDLTDTLIAEFEKWATSESLPGDHYFRNRLAGGNRYCKVEYHADEQVLAESKSYNHNATGRYTVLNYCYRRFGTIECRLLPMFEDVAQSIRAIEHLVNLMSAYLVVTAKRDEKLDFDLSLVTAPYQEESFECV